MKYTKELLLQDILCKPFTSTRLNLLMTMLNTLSDIKIA